MKLWDTRQPKPVYQEKYKDHIQDLALKKNLVAAISNKKDELIFVEVGLKQFKTIKTVKTHHSIKKSIWKDNFLFVTDQKGNIIIYYVNHIAQGKIEVNQEHVFSTFCSKCDLIDFCGENLVTCGQDTPYMTLWDLQTGPDIVACKQLSSDKNFDIDQIACQNDLLASIEYDVQRKVFNVLIYNIWEGIIYPKDQQNSEVTGIGGIQ